jgi:hypothetical protein
MNIYQLLFGSRLKQFSEVIDSVVIEVLIESEWNGPAVAPNLFRSNAKWL